MPGGGGGEEVEEVDASLFVPNLFIQILLNYKFGMFGKFVACVKNPNLTFKIIKLG